MWREYHVAEREEVVLLLHGVAALNFPDRTLVVELAAAVVKGVVCQRYRDDVRSFGDANATPRHQQTSTILLRLLAV